MALGEGQDRVRHLVESVFDSVMLSRPLLPAETSRGPSIVCLILLKPPAPVMMSLLYDSDFRELRLDDRDVTTFSEHAIQTALVRVE